MTDKTVEEPYLNFSESIRICAKTLHIDESGIGIIESLVNHVIKESVNEKDVSLNEKNASLNHCIQFENEQSKIIASLESENKRLNSEIERLGEQWKNECGVKEEAIKLFQKERNKCESLEDQLKLKQAEILNLRYAIEKYNALKTKK